MLFMASVSFAAVTTEQSNQASSLKKYTYEDNDLWLALPQKEKIMGSESYLFTQLSSAVKTKRSRLYLWFGEPANPNNGDAIAIKDLTQSGEVWYLDTPEALFVDRSRMSMRKLDGLFVKEIVNQATQAFDEVVVITADVASVPVLRGLRLFQEQTNANRQAIKNVILLYPSLFVNAPTAGEVPELFPISYQTALPITILQPRLGTQANTIGLTEKALKMGGSLVQTEIINGATDGYFKYQDIREMAKNAAIRIKQSSDNQIKKVLKINYQVAKLDPINVVIPETKIISGLVKIDPPIPMKTIELNDLNGQAFNVPGNYQGKALLVNFWATWCPHCVEEIPSMNRALEELDDEKFAMISISYQDTKAILDEFVKKVQVDFPILLDSDGMVSKEWNIFAFPSSFLVDANGYIRYSINAGSIWDSPEMLNYLREVMEIPIEDTAKQPLKTQ